MTNIKIKQRKKAKCTAHFPFAYITYIFTYSNLTQLIVDLKFFVMHSVYNIVFSYANKKIVITLFIVLERKRRIFLKVLKQFKLIIILTSYLLSFRIHV